MGQTVAVLAIVVASSSASAEPRETPPHVEYAVRIGVSWMQTVTNLGPAPQGNGPSIDGEVGWRFPRMSVAAFGAFYTLHEAMWWTDQCVYGSNDARYNFFNVGGRMSFHGVGDGGPFVGFGIAEESVLEYGRASFGDCNDNFCSSKTPAYSNRRYTAWSNAMLFEAHVGATLPKLSGVAIDLMALVGYGTNPDDHNYLLFTERLAIGARF